MVRRTIYPVVRNLRTRYNLELPELLFELLHFRLFLQIIVEDVCIVRACLPWTWRLQDLSERVSELPQFLGRELVGERL